MAEVHLKCRTCGVEGAKHVLWDEWINEDESVKAHLCFKCMTKEENDMFWEDCVCEKCKEPCKLQRHMVKAIRLINIFPLEDGKGHLYCQLCQIYILKGEEGVQKLKMGIIQEAVHAGGIAAKESAHSLFPFGEMFVMIIIPIVAAAYFILTNIESL